MANEGVEAQPMATEGSGNRRRITGSWHSVGGHRHLARLAITVAVVLATLFLRWGAGASLLLGLLAASVSGLIDGRLSVAVGLVCLASSPILIIADQHAWLQQSALVNYYAASAGIYSLGNVASTTTTWAFYFLCIGLAGRMVSYVVRAKNRDSA